MNWHPIVYQIKYRLQHLDEQIITRQIEQRLV